MEKRYLPMHFTANTETAGSLMKPENKRPRLHLESQKAVAQFGESSNDLANSMPPSISVGMLPNRDCRESTVSTP